jgi:Common central domain of tyrosinase
MTHKPSGLVGNADHAMKLVGGGALELTPHNAIHSQVGKTPGGWMQDPDLAARDPIFASTWPVNRGW